MVWSAVVLSVAADVRGSVVSHGVVSVVLSVVVAVVWGVVLSEVNTADIPFGF